MRPKTLLRTVRAIVVQGFLHIYTDRYLKKAKCRTHMLGSHFLHDIIFLKNTRRTTIKIMTASNARSPTKDVGATKPALVHHKTSLRTTVDVQTTPSAVPLRTLPRSRFLWVRPMPLRNIRVSLDRTRKTLHNRSPTAAAPLLYGAKSGVFP